MAEILLNILLLYAYTIAVSLLLILVSVFSLRVNVVRRECIYKKYGIREFFSHRNKGSLIYLTLFIPLVNVIISIWLLLIILTDIGDIL